VSRQNVEAFTRGNAATDRRDVDALLEELDPEVEWHSAFEELLGGEGMVYRGHEGIREFFRDFDEAFSEFHFEYSDIRDLGEQLIALGRLRGRGRESGAQLEVPIGVLVDFKNGKATRVRSFDDPKEALRVAGLPE
jgi:uncharacterized protein